MGLDIGGIPEIDEGWQVRVGAATLVGKLQLVSERAGDIKADWAGLAAPYQAPEQGLVLQAMDEPVTQADDLLDKGIQAQTALSDYGDELDRLKTERATLIADIESFQAEKAEKDENGGGFLGHEDWLLGESRDLLGKEEDLSGRISAFAEAVDAAQRTCANALNAIWGGPEWLAADRADVGYEYVYGLNSESYDQLQLSGEVPWGTPDEWTEGDWTTKAYMFGRGAVRSVTDLVEFGGVLIGVGAEDGETSAAWSGLGAMAKDLAVLAVPLPLIPAVAATEGGREAYSNAGNRLLEMGKSTIGYGTWGTSGWNTAGGFAPDIIAAVVSGGSATAVKSGLKSAAGSILTRTAPSAATRVIDLGNAVRRTLDTPINGLRNLGESVRTSFRNPLDGNGPGTDLPDATVPDVDVPGGRGTPDVDTPSSSTPSTPEAPVRTPDAEAPVRTPDGEAPVRTPDGEAPVRTPDGEAPVGTPDGEAPVRMPDGEAPVGTPDGEAPVRMPDGEAPVRTPDGEAPVRTPDGEAPVRTPDGEAPVRTPDGEAPVRTPDGEAPVRTPDGEAPVRTPDGEAPVRTPDGEAPVRTPDGEAPVRTPDGETPDRTPDAETPDRTPDAETPDRTPDAVTPDRTPDAVTPDRTPDAVTPDRTPDRTPEAETPDRTPDAEAPADRAPEGEAWPPGRAPGDDVAPPTRPDYEGDRRSGMLGRPPETQGPPLHVDRGDPLMPGPRERFGDGLGPGDLPPNTEIVVRGRGVFYTDENGMVRFVEPMERTVGRDGKTPLQKSQLIPELRDPLPNTTYLVDNNGFFQTDAAGRTTHVHVDDLRWVPESDRRHSAPANRNVTGGGSIFDAGHLWPRMAGGRPEEINLVQMLREINQGSAKRHAAGQWTVSKLERQLTAAMKGDSTVTWDVRVRYVDEPADFSGMSAAERRALSVPKSFTYQPSIDGKALPRIRIPNA
ncbi:DNA/RNA non-specific endonuclease [Nocardioides sp. CFH 31398]|uniref:DNA/RNA non-specific endonuclease n=1 Tax=Nocardioides sp. CFH 31398 TaxID=2919579 RepID=UPI001F060926|nr:DNA/RNA non-specific endonuclease [Nocardioides sp. CFH 31398]MCH1865811.1 DNA/RNA non-specific endonuclease [Nocardioides sp. CFH 31398]